MLTAVENDIPGIMAECGGSMSCATCHVYVDESQIASIPPPDLRELETLEFAAAERRAGSRLSCQLRIEEDMHELVVHIPDTQV